MITLKNDGLLTRWYRYWVRLGGTPYPQENVCHFLRVILLYAPARWFFSCDIRTTGKMKDRLPPVAWIVLSPLILVVGPIAFISDWLDSRPKRPRQPQQEWGDVMRARVEFRALRQSQKDGVICQLVRFEE